MKIFNFDEIIMAMLYNHQRQQYRENREVNRSENSGHGDAGLYFQHVGD